MRVCGVVAEYNPFHNGHKYQLEKIKESGFDGVVAVMSGNAVQRGELAVAQKQIRARQALLNGVDLVVELPLPFSLSSAEKFALGSVSILDSLGVVGSLCFGSESGNMEMLEKIADFDVNGRISDYLFEGITYATAFQSLIKDELGENYADILSLPNNILGIEYLKAIKRFNSKIKPLTVKRYGAGHSEMNAENGFCSASFIRENIKKSDISDYMPPLSFETLNNAIKNGVSPVSLYNNETLVLSMLRSKNPDSFSCLPDISEGIENRLYSAVRNACSLDELYNLIKTKRYTMARVKRLVLNAFFGISADYTKTLPPYIRVLGFNEKGCDILRNAKLSASKPIYTLYSDFSNADMLSKQFYSLECTATDLYFCFTPEIKPCGMEQTESAVIIK